MTDQLISDLRLEQQKTRDAKDRLNANGYFVLTLDEFRAAVRPYTLIAWFFVIMTCVELVIILNFLGFKPWGPW